MSTLFKFIFSIVGGVFALLAASGLLTLIYLGETVYAVQFFAVIGGLIYVILHRAKRKEADDTASKIPFIETKRNRSPTGDKVFEGHGAIIELTDHSIIISRHGLGSFLTQGIKGEKTIPFKSLTALQFKPAQKQMGGYIQFSVKGEVASRGGIFDATLDENTVMFTIAQHPNFEMLRKKIDAEIAKQDNHPIAARLSYADELTKLADLRDRGVLDETEFQNQKTRLSSVTV
jgi:Short C-terminal domain/Domain of unknown function (DUF4429)